MPHPLQPYNKSTSPSFNKLYRPAEKILPKTPVLESKGDKPLKMTFEDQLKALIFYHLEEHSSGRELLQVLKQDDFARKYIAPKDGIEKSSFFEAINTRGLEQLQFVYHHLCREAKIVLPDRYAHLGNLVAIDGSLIDAVLSMTWADYRKDSKKAKLHLGFDINRGIPTKLHLTDGKAGERPFVSQILDSGQTGVCDRGYQDHDLFISLQIEGKSFIIRIKAGTTKTMVRQYDVQPGGIVFYDAEVILGTNQNHTLTQTPVRLVGYRISGVDYWIATDRRDLTAEQVAEAYKLRWEIESFFGWWKRHLKVYHLIARSRYGLMVQIYAGLITYLLLAIYCQQVHKERVSIKRVRELRIQIQNELRQSGCYPDDYFFKEQYHARLHAKT
jgi:hypothetical protein